MIISWLNRGGLIRCVRSGWLYLVAVGFLLACISYVTGCGASQVAISGQATVHRAHQAERFDFYGELDEVCGPQFAPHDLAGYRRCMGHARRIADFADSYRRTLETAQHLLNASDEDGFMAMVPDLTAAAEDLIGALTSAGLDVPGVIASVAQLLTGGDDE